MDVESARDYLRTLPHFEEVLQWGAKLVYRAGAKEQGGKMFALLDLEEPVPGSPREPPPVLSFYAGPVVFAELLEREGFVPAPYLARAWWVALTGWDQVDSRELRRLLSAAHTGVWTRLPARTRQAIAHEQTETPPRGVESASRTRTKK